MPPSAQDILSAVDTPTHSIFSSITCVLETFFWLLITLAVYSTRARDSRYSADRLDVSASGLNSRSSIQAVEYILECYSPAPG